MTQEIIDRAAESLFEYIKANPSDDSTLEVAGMLMESSRILSYTRNVEMLLLTIGPGIIKSSIASILLIGFQLGQRAQKQESEIEALEKML